MPFANAWRGRGQSYAGYALVLRDRRYAGCTIFGVGIGDVFEYLETGCCLLVEKEAGKGSFANQEKSRNIGLRRKTVCFAGNKANGIVGV